MLARSMIVAFLPTHAKYIYYLKRTLSELLLLTPFIRFLTRSNNKRQSFYFEIIGVSLGLTPATIKCFIN